MAQRRTKMERIRKIIELHFKSDLSERCIAKAVKVSRPTVKKYIIAFQESGLDYNAIADMPDSELIERLNTNKESDPDSEKYLTLASQFDYFTKELKRTGVTLQTLWKEYIEKHSDGYKYSRFCYYFSEHCHNNQLNMHMFYKAGDKLFVDFTGKKMQIVDIKTGEYHDVEVFVAILGATGYTYAEAVMSQGKADWIKANANALIFFGGVPAAIVPDCLKSAVTKADKYEPDINPDYDDFAHHYGTVILPARPVHPKDKALVENAVNLVYQRVFALLRNRVFHSLEELNIAIREKVDIHNNTKFQRSNYTRMSLFQETEETTLKPLPAIAYELKDFEKRKVEFNYHVFVKGDNRYYSVPWQYRNKQVDIRYTSRVVEIYYDKVRIASHQREFSGKRYVTKAEHMPPQHAFYASWSPERFLGWAHKIGEYVELVIAKVLQNCEHPEQGYKVCLGILNLAKKYGDLRLNLTCKRAVNYGSYSLKAIKTILEKGLDKIADSSPEQQLLPFHDNIRGSEYYGQEAANE
jgi:transposase